MNPSHVILGFGALGRAIAQSLLEQGENPRVITRSGNAPVVPQGVELVQGDVTNYEQLLSLTTGTKVIYQATQPAYSRWAEEFPPLQQTILQVAIAHKSKVVLGENLYGYGKPPQGIITDTTPINPQETKGRVRAQMSEDALKLHQSGTLEVACIRASDFFGPWAWDQSHLGSRSLGPLAKGKAAQMIGKVDLPHTFTYILDYGRAMAQIGLQNTGWGKVWLVPNSNPTMSQKDRLEVTARLLNQPLKIQTAGKGLLTFFSLFSPMVKEIIPMLYQFEEPYVVQSDSFESTFGIQATPFDQAMAETLAWAEQQGYTR